MKNRKILKITVRFCFAKKYIVQRIKFTQKVAKSGTKWIRLSKLVVNCHEEKEKGKKFFFETKYHSQNRTAIPSLDEVMPSNADKVTSSSLSASSPVALLLINQSRTFPSSVISPENVKEIIN